MKRAALTAIGAALALGACAIGSDDVGENRSGGPKIDTCAGGGGFVCEGATAVACIDKSVRIDCAADGKSCHPGIGCVNCVPGTGSCENGVATVCRADGTETVAFECDPAQGMICQGGKCSGTCAWGSLGASYLGCDYYPTVTMNNGLWGGFEFAVALSNVGHASANVIVTRGGETLKTLSVAPGKLEVVRLPWVKELKGPDPNFMGQPQPPGESAKVASGAYRVRSDQPIAVYQFNPLDYRLDPPPAECPHPAEETGCFSYSNDASLLLPAHMLRNKYAVMTWPSLGCKPAFFTVTALYDDTEVTIDKKGEIWPGGGFDSSGQGYAKLAQGDVVQVIAKTTGGPFCFDSIGSDISGTIVTATRPVQVIAGHGCANVPAPETQACDHVEEVMFPFETLGGDYVVAVPMPPSGAPVDDTSHSLRIAAVDAPTTVRFDPPIHEPIALGPNDAPIELRYVRENVRIKADRRIIIAQFVHGTDANGDPTVSGDPAQSLAIPIGEFRNEYTFLAPDNYPENFVDVVGTLGQTVIVDDQTVTLGQSVGDSGFAVAHVKLGPGSVHVAHADKPFGITVYGYGDWTSYMYPGGLNLGALSPIVE